MGIKIEERTLGASPQAFRLLVYCEPRKEQIDAAISVNKLLAEKLVAVKPNRRTMKIERCFGEVIASLPSDATIKDIDVMFNPSYKLDIIKILIEANKKKTFSVIWPGKIVGESLIYSTEELSDYHIYDINNYDIVCVI